MITTKNPILRPTLRGLVLALAVTALSSFVARAVPYASGISNDGSTVYFVLNQNAASVEVLRDGGSPVYPGTNAGTLSFSMAGHTTYQIKVTGNDAPVWTKYVADQTSTSFEYPFGVAVNKNPSSANFGKVYVSQGRNRTNAFGRVCYDGIYMLNADGSEAGFTTGGQSWTGDSSPYRCVVGPDDHLYVADLYSDMAYEFNDDMSVATPLIEDANKTTGQFVHSLYVEGTKAAGNRKLYLVNGNPASGALRKGLIRYDLDSADTAIGLGTGTQWIGPTYWGTTYYGYDVARDSAGDWYMSTYRALTASRPPITKFNGAGTIPLNTPVWEASNTNYYAFSIAVDDLSGLVAYGHNNGGPVNFFSKATGAFVQSLNTGGGAVRELVFDAAGNLITVDNSLEWARFWSPGGYTVATTSFDGTQRSFQIVRPATQVSVTASQATVSEAGPAVTYTITRVGSTAEALTVNYAMSGTASNGVDYATLSGSAVIPATASSVTVTLTPLEDAIAELSETAVLGLLANSNYSAVLPSSATVSILDNETPEISFASAAPKKLIEGYAPSKVTHQVVRRGLLTPALTVNVTYSGTATRTADFTGAMTVALGANAVNANLALTPINDQAYEGNETATANIAAGTGYTIGTASSISATVVDDEPPPGTVLFSDDFDADSSALWKVNLADPANGSVVFAWDYSTLGVPAAPGGGGTKGMRMQCGNIIVNQDAVSASPLGQSFTGDYRLKFDMWINYNGPMPDGGPGSTQNFDAGVGTSGEGVVWLYSYSPPADGVWFTAACDGASGYAVGDYNAMIGATLLNDESGVYAAGTGAPDSGIRDASHSYYSLWGGQAAPAAQLALYPTNQTGVANIGNAGMAWHTVVITKAGDVVTWVMDGITLATVTNTIMPWSTNVFVGYQDLWAGGNPSNRPELSFGLVDNLKVMSLAAPLGAATITSIVPGTGSYSINYTGGGGSQFVLLKSSTANAPMTSWTRVATNATGSGVFSVAAEAPKFYRISSE